MPAEADGNSPVGRRLPGEARQARVRLWLRARVNWDAVVAVQKLRCRALDVWFTHFPFLGNELQYVLLMPWLAWFGGDDGGVARRCVLVVFATSFLNNAAKDLLRLPRPPHHLRVVQDAHVDQQFGFPSTHSALALALAWRLAAEYTSARAWCVAGVYVIHVCLSRLYLGVHCLTDVAGGLLIGALATAAFAAVGAALDAAANATPLLTALGCAAALRWLYPDARASNSTYTELLLFAGLYLGANFGSGECVIADSLAGTSQRRTTFLGACDAGWYVEHRLVGAPRRLPSWPVAAAVQFAYGLVLLGEVRSHASRASKALVRRAGGWREVALLAHHLLISLLAGWWVLRVHPAAFMRMTASCLGLEPLVRAFVVDDTPRDEPGGPSTILA